jgi:hypothetical protein
MFEARGVPGALSSNLVETNVAGVGVWGGPCTCPDGNTYFVGDNSDYCKTIACVGGTSGECIHTVSEKWRARKVTCAGPVSPDLGPFHLRVHAWHGDFEWSAQLDQNGQSDQEVCVAPAGEAWPLCFEIRNQASTPVIYRGCSSIDLVAMATGERTIESDTGDDASLRFHVPFLDPPSPPVPAPPPEPPHPSTPPPPPPYQLWPGNLDSAKCRAMLRDPQHVFRRMWSVEGWAKQELKGACWDSKRDDAKTSQPMHTYFSETLAGTHCRSNWYEGNPGLLGLQGRPPTSFYIEDAPALFGVDADIGSVCQNAMRANGMTPSNAFGHSGNCVAAGYNILNLNSPRVPYNLCRNLEWQVCAARNQIPAQGQSAVMFATAPRSLDPDGARSVGKCAGWRPDASYMPDGGYGYANEDIFYLEACLFDQICDNGPDIFDNRDWLKVPFRCEFNPALFQQLEDILSEPADLSVDPEECQEYSREG